jgi:hypothetical protein
MIRYNGGSGSTWYVGKRTSSQLVGTESFHFYSEAAGATVGGVDPYGNMFASGSSRAPVFYDSNNTVYFLLPSAIGTSLNVAGAITAGGNITSSSDIRLKEDIQVITNALDKVKQIKGVTYTRKETKKRHSGVIAQDVIKVLPEVVEGTEESLYTVAYGNMIGLLIEAIKEQNEQIEKLNKMVIEISNRVNIK